MTKSSDFDILDTTACDLLSARARFSPATDRKGRPVESRWSSRFVWRLPERRNDPLPLAERLRKIRFVVSKLGAVLSCEPTDEKDRHVNDMDNVCTTLQNVVPARALLDMRGYGPDDASLVEMEEYFLLTREGREDLFVERRGFETRSLAVWRLTIGPDGRVTDCAMTSQRGSTVLLEGYRQFCSGTANARFQMEDAATAPLPITAWRIIRVGPIKARIGTTDGAAETRAVN